MTHLRNWGNNIASTIFRTKFETSKGENIVIWSVVGPHCCEI